MEHTVLSPEDLIRASSHALVIGIGGGGDVVGALATARFLEFCGLTFTLGGLSWERYVYDPVPGPRALAEIENIRCLHPRIGMARADTQTLEGVRFAESHMAAVQHSEVLLVDINGGVAGVVEGLEKALEDLGADLLVGVDVGGDALATGLESGLRSPLADSIMLAACAELERRGRRVFLGVFGYGSDGELAPHEIEAAISVVARAGGFLGGWALTPKIVRELKRVVEEVHTEASAIPLFCAEGAWGETSIRSDGRKVKLTPLTTITFFVSPRVVLEALSRPGRAVASSTSLDQANEALHALGMRTELDLERDRYDESQGSRVQSREPGNPKWP